MVISPVILNLDSVYLSDEQFYQLCQNNQELKFERNTQIELRSATDELEPLRRKMLEYLDAGVQLGWLINPQQQQVEIYRREKPVELRNLPTELSGEEILPGFSLNLSLF